MLLMKFPLIKFRSAGLLTLLGVALMFVSFNVHRETETKCLIGVDGKTECVLFHNGSSNLAVRADPLRFLPWAFAASIFAFLLDSVFYLTERFYAEPVSKFWARFLSWLSLTYRTGLA